MPCHETCPRSSRWRILVAVGVMYLGPWATALRAEGIDPDPLAELRAEIAQLRAEY